MKTVDLKLEAVAIPVADVDHGIAVSEVFHRTGPSAA